MIGVVEIGVGSAIELGDAFLVAALELKFEIGLAGRAGQAMVIELELVEGGLPVQVGEYGPELTIAAETIRLLYGL